MALIQVNEFPSYGLPKLQSISNRPTTNPTNRAMGGRAYAERARKEEYFEILDETIRTNPYRKAATAMVSVMAKHGIESKSNKPPGDQPPTSEKKCALSRALKLAQNCNLKLTTIREDLQALCHDFGKKPPNPAPAAVAAVESGDGVAEGGAPPKNTDKAAITGHLVTLIGEAETIARRIYETAVGLHVTEDYLRQPEDLKLLDFSSAGRIQIPNYNFNHASQLCLEWLHSTALKWLRGFKEEGEEENGEFIKIFEHFTKAVKDFTEAVCLANQVFRVLLYPNLQGKESLREYISGVGHVLKNDIIMEVQALRRAFDSIQYAFERVGWAASIAWMKYSGKKITVETLNDSGLQVDHSTFQYKFYEGPPKGKWKKHGASRDVRRKKSTSKSASSSSVNKGTTEGPELGKAVPKKKSVHVLARAENEEEPGLPVDVKLKSTKSQKSTDLEEPSPVIQRPSQAFQEEVSLSRRSRSTPDIAEEVKSKKKLKHKKSKTAINIEGPTPRAAPSPYKASKGEITGVKVLSKEEKASASIPATKHRAPPSVMLPHNLHQQFSAVFGSRIMPMKTVKPVKKEKLPNPPKAETMEDGNAK